MDVMDEHGVSTVAIVGDDGRVMAIREQDIRSALLRNASPYSAVTDFCMNSPPTVLPNASESDLRRFFSSGHDSVALVVDADGQYAGLVVALDLFGHRVHPARPGLVGGLATPFGVYLTNGVVSGGAKGLALLSTGALLSLAFLVGFFATVGFVGSLGAGQGDPGFAELLSGQVEGWQLIAINGLPALLFLILLRTLPLAGTHAAEHMVVHAIERREPLSYEVVARMPRVHPRCGTNLAVGALLFTGFLSILTFELGPILSLLLTIALWRRVGGWVQYLFTTKPPTRSQILDAIAAGSELLANFRRSERLVPSLSQRILNTGLPWVLAGGLLISLLFYVLTWAFGYPIPIF